MKVQNIILKDWLQPITCLVIAENDDWILTKYIPMQYVVDGYKVIKKNIITKREKPADHDLLKRVLELKKISQEVPKGFFFGSGFEMLQWCEQEYGLFEFQDLEENDLFYGRINRIDDEQLFLDLIKEDGETKRNLDHGFLKEDIWVISFESDYFRSIRLLDADEQVEIEGQPSSDD